MFDRPFNRLVVSLLICGFASELLAEERQSGSPYQLESITVDQTHVTIRGHAQANGGSGLWLAELLPHQKVEDAATGQRWAFRPDRDGGFTVKVPRFSETEDRIFSRWAIMSGQGAQARRLTTARWADQVDEAAEYQDLKPSSGAAVKGLNGIHPDPRLFPDLVELGVGQIGVNVQLGGLLAEDGSDGVPFRYLGHDYVMRRAAVEMYDRLLGFAGENDIVATAIILVPRLDRASELGRRLTHPDAIDGHYSMANVTSDEGWRAYAACLSFLASRYGPANSPNGRFAYWIIHNEVDAGWVWTNAGEKPADEYMHEYLKSMRVAHYAVRRYDPHAEVFISLTHHWATPHQPNPLRYYPSRDLLEILAQSTRAEGDFAWGVAFHPYPQNLFEPRTWNDDQAEDSFDTPQITFRNLQVLDRWLKQDRYLDSDGEQRTIFLSEQGFHTPGKGAEAEAVQAAALAYAWKKIEQFPSIKAFHYHRWIDHEREGGLLLGLWTVEPGSITWPKDKKLSWSVFQALGTERQEAVIEFAKPIIGIEQWSELK